jgi:tetratricopeptide (TPR) repeat protein
MGEHEQGLAYAEQAEQIYRELEDKRMIALSLGNRSLMNRQLRRFSVAEALVAECTQLARELGDRPMLAKNQMNRGIMLVELARFQEAEIALKEAERLFGEQQNPKLRAVCVENLAYIAGKRGDLDAALQGLSAAANMLDGQDGAETLAGIQAARAETLLDYGRAQEALAPAREAADYWRAHAEAPGRDNFRAYAALALALDKAADPRAATRAAREALGLAARLNYTPRDPSHQMTLTLEKLNSLVRE